MSKIELGGEFGFIIDTQNSEYQVAGRPVVLVALPHQCDEWAIAVAADVEAAAEGLRRFLAEGQAALEALEALL